MTKRVVPGLLASTFLACSWPAFAGQSPYGAAAADIPLSSRDRVYAAEQFSNTVSVTDPSSNKLLGSFSRRSQNFSPLYRGQVLVHGMGFSPDNRTIAVVSIGSNSVSFIDAATNTVKHTTYLGRSPHEPFFTPDGKEVWVTVRGEDYVAVLDGTTYEEKPRIKVPTGPGMHIVSPDGNFGYICSSFTQKRHRRHDHRCRARPAEESLLSKYCSDAGRATGMVHAERYRQDAGV